MGFTDLKVCCLVCCRTRATLRCYDFPITGPGDVMPSAVT